MRPRPCPIPDRPRLEAGVRLLWLRQRISPAMGTRVRLGELESEPLETPSR